MEQKNDIVYGMFNLCEERELARASFGYIMSDFQDIKSRYIALGFHLDEFRRMQYYKDFGYTTFESFCEKNVPLDKGSISRCIGVWEQFALRQGYSRKMYVDDKYKDYSYSQLVEMLPIDSRVYSVIPATLPVAKIRLVKKFSKQFKHIYDDEVMKIIAFIKSGCPEDAIPGKEEIVATSQPEEVDEDENIPLYSSEQLSQEDFISQMFSRIKKDLEFLSLDICNVKCSGKQMSFEDLDGNQYSLLYRVMKKKEDDNDV